MWWAAGLVLVALGTIYSLWAFYPWEGQPIASASIPLFSSDVKWHQDFTWFTNDLFAGTRWAYPRQDGGLFYIDDNNSYVALPGGTPGPTANLESNRNLWYCSNVIPVGADNYIAANADYISRISADGTTTWQQLLKPRQPLGPYQKLVRLHFNGASTLVVFGPLDLWTLNSATGEVVTHIPLDSTSAPFSKEVLPLENGFLFIALAGTKDYALDLVSLGADGQVRWRQPIGRSDIAKLLPLPNGNFLVSMRRPGIKCFDASGRQLWSKTVSIPEMYDGLSVAVSSLGVIAMWSGTTLHFYDEQGRTVAPPVQLSVQCGASSPDQLHLLAGPGDGFVVELESAFVNEWPRAQIPRLVFGPRGDPRARLSLSGDLELIATRKHSEIYALRKGRVLERSNFASSLAVQIVCLQVTPPTGSTSPPPAPVPAPGRG